MKKTKIMGILNVTPDSFYDGGRFRNPNEAIERGIAMSLEGADIIDVGGESTRPFSAKVAEDDELQRVIPVIEGLRKRVSCPISIDTMKPQVAERAIAAGASIINDVGGFRLPKMIAVARKNDVRVCAVHMLGTPQTMQIEPHYKEGIIPHLINWIRERGETLLFYGIKREKIIMDPGIGFGKTVDDNLKILQNLPKLKMAGFPLLVGLSRKSFMGKIVGKGAADLLPTTIALNGYLAMRGVEYIRVHDVAEHADILKVINRLR